MKIVYLTTCFGTQSHTFMRREIRALRALGASLELYGIHKDKEFTAQDAQDLVDETTYLYPIQKKATLLSNLSFFFQNPIRYLKGLGNAFLSPEFSLARRLKMVGHYLLAAPFAKDMLDRNVTHIHAQFLNVSSSIAMYASEHSGIPFSITVHSAGSYKAADTVGLHQKLQQAQFLIMISHYNVQYYNSVTPCRDKSHVIRCGMNLDDFDFQPAVHSQVSLQAPSGFPHKTFLLLGVGRFVAKKGFRYLIDAAHLLKQRNIPFQLHLIGSGPLDHELRALVTQLQLNDSVLFLGHRSTSDVRKAMADADVVVVPSITTDQGDMEGLPVVIMEAMATGTAVVASAHAGIPEIVLPEKTGYLTKERDPESIADAITRALSISSPLMLDEARNLIEEQFNIQVVAQQRLALFQRYD